MPLYIVVPVVVLALLIAASGVAAVSHGWVLPTNRRPVRRPRLYGWAQLIVSFALCWQMVFLLVLSDSDTRRWGTLAGSALLLTGLVAMTVSHGRGGDRQGGGTP
ncbi:hypothetical protein ACIRD8_24540 [Streptomyces sp. NPDC102451]|uniref:hypothetical protein n=1 Tax=Streptomyces sp. NPDC102451 TaxID=3366177 RepID=UPI00380E5933